MKPIAIFLYSKSVTIAKPWARAGVDCYLFDVQHGEDRGTAYRRFKGTIYTYGGKVQQHRKLLGQLCRNNRVLLIGAFPPCTDLAFSGARFFMQKSLKDSFYWAKAMELYWYPILLADFFNIPFFCENPKSMIMHFDRKPDFKFNPNDYGGYLPKQHTHRYFPHIYPGRDAYAKETWIWCGNGFVIPDKKPVPVIATTFPAWNKVSGTSDRAKEIRSVTPEGFAVAVFKANYQDHPSAV